MSSARRPDTRNLDMLAAVAALDKIELKRETMRRQKIESIAGNTIQPLFSTVDVEML
eukprot:COSAG05_NODE_8124_length_734_cov_1.162205_2_plen_57_part_00